MWNIKTITARITRPNTGILEFKRSVDKNYAYEMFADDKIARDEALYEYGNRYGVLQDELRDLARMDADLIRESHDIARQRADVAAKAVEIKKKLAGI